MNMNEILDIMEDMLENAWTVPLSGGKSVIDVERFQEMVNDIRLNMPQEIKQARLIVTDRKIILDDAKKEAEQIIKTAEERARRMVNEDEITKRSKAKAKELALTTQTQAKELKRGANEYSEKVLRETEKALMEAMNEIKTAKSALRSNAMMK